MPSSKGIFSFGVSFRLTIEPQTQNTRDSKGQIANEGLTNNGKDDLKEAIEQQKTENEMRFKLLLSTGKGET